MPPGGQNLPSIVLLEFSQNLFHDEVVCCGGGGAFCHLQGFFFLSFLSPSLEIHVSHLKFYSCHLNY
jgi:hypothetical protein